MPSFLDQDAIDALQEKLSSLSSLQEDANNAKDKIAVMYYDLCKTPLRSKLDTLDEIGNTIDEMEKHLKYDSKYAESFFMLRNSYIKRL